MDEYEYRVYLNDYPNLKTTKKLTKVQKDVLSVLLFNGRNCDGKFTMCHNYLTTVLGISNHVVSVAIGRLEDLKFITVVRGHKGVYTQYTINYDVLREFGNELSKDSTMAVKTIVNKRTETDITTQILKQLCVLSTKLDTMIEILQSISDNVTSNDSEGIPNEIDYAKTAERIAKNYREHHNLTDK